MTNLHEFFQWLLLMFPICITPGPLNILCAITGARAGFIKSIPFLVGAYVFPLIYSVTIGFGANFVLNTYPEVFKVIRWVGSAYILYLAYKLFMDAIHPQSSSKQSMDSKVDKKPLTFKEGLLSQMFNVKIITGYIMMYSQFLDPVDQGNKIREVLTLTIGEIILGVLCNSVWIVGGKWMVSQFDSPKAHKIEGFVFSSLMLVVGVWIIMD